MADKEKLEDKVKPSEGDKETRKEGKRHERTDRKTERKEKTERGRAGYLVPRERYLEAGVHIGTRVKTGQMRRFIYMKRNDGLYVLDIKKTDERIRYAAKILAQYEPEDILVTASRVYSSIAAANFAKITGAKLYPGRFVPGVLTNPNRPDFMEPKILIVSDPRGEREAIIEAGKMGIPVIALCDTDNVTRNVDYIIPCNNKGRRSLALIYYLLTREYLMARGAISSYSEFKYPVKLFTDDTALEEIKKNLEKLRKEGPQLNPVAEQVVREIAAGGEEGSETDEETEEKVEEDTIKKENVPVEEGKAKVEQ